MMKQRCVILCIMLFFTGQLLFAQARWVRKIPVSKDHYIGVGMSKKNVDGVDYISLARDRALAQIASGISVTLTTETSQKIREHSEILEEEFASNVLSVAQASLEDYELVDSWENKEEYWVYYRLSKRQYQLNLEKKKRMSVDLALNYVKQAQHETDVVKRLQQYFLAAQAIYKFRGFDLGSVEGFDRPLDVLVFDGIRKHLAALKYTISPSKLSLAAFKKYDEDLLIGITFSNEEMSQQAVHRFPLKLHIIKGKITCLPIELTNSSGETKLRIEKLSGIENVHFNLVPDLVALTGTRDEHFIQAMEKEPYFSSQLVTVELIPPRVFLAVRELNTGVVTNSTLFASLKQFFSEKNFLIESDEEKADFIVDLSFSSRKGVEMYGVYTAFASAKLSMYPRLQKNQVKTLVIDEINGGGQSFEQAGNQALKKISDQFVTELPKLLNEL